MAESRGLAFTIDIIVGLNRHIRHLFCRFVGGSGAFARASGRLTPKAIAAWRERKENRSTLSDLSDYL